MDMRRYKEVFSGFCIVLSLFSTAWSTQGMVLCIAPDHTAIEPARENKCDHGPDSSACLLPIVSVTPDGCKTGCECGPCVDLPLNGDTTAPLQRVRDKSQNQTFRLLAGLVYSATDHQEGFALFSAATRAGRPDSLIASISTSILRI